MIMTLKKLAPVSFIKLRFIFIIFCTLTVTFFTPLLLQACPGCASAINGDLGRGLNTSILFMMAMPFTTIGLIASCIFFMYRRAQPSATKPVKQKTTAA